MNHDVRTDPNTVYEKGWDPTTEQAVELINEGELPGVRAYRSISVEIEGKDDEEAITRLLSFVTLHPEYSLTQLSYTIRENDPYDLIEIKASFGVCDNPITGREEREAAKNALRQAHFDAMEASERRVPLEYEELSNALNHMGIPHAAATVEGAEGKAVFVLDTEAAERLRYLLDHAWTDDRVGRETLALRPEEG